MTEEMSPYSDAALAKQRLIDEKVARGEQVTWSDLRGYLQPNPDLPDCQAWEDDYKCQRPNHHDGPHRVVIEWGGKTDQTDATASTTGRDDAWHQGGYVEGTGVEIRVEPAGQCPNGHAQYRINGSPYVEHVVSQRDLPGALNCPYRVVYKPKERA